MALRRPALTALLLTLSGAAPACERVARPWSSPEDAAPPDAPPAAPDASPDLGADVLPDAPGATPDTPDAGPDIAPDGADATSCGADAELVIARVWSLVATHATTPSEAFRRCLEHADFTPSPAAFAEEIINRLRGQRVVGNVCDDLVGVGAHGLASATPYGMALEVTFSRAALATERPERLAAAAVHQLLHHERYDHYGTDDGEGRWGVPALAERCMLQALGEADLPGAPPLLPRDAMAVESELQPFGVVRPWNASPFYAECPPGTWAMGEGLTLRSVSSSPATDHVTALGLRCQARAGGATTDVGSPVAQWAGCGAGRVAVGVVADANVNGLYSARLLCVDWTAAGHPARAEAPVDLPHNPTGYTIERRCPPGQALFALSGAVDSPAWVLSLAVHCHDVDVSRVGGYTELAAVGASTYPGTRLRRVARCADQGVLTGFFGHRRRDEQGFSRLGGVCRSTAWAGGSLRFRSLGEGAAAREVPEHPAAGAGGDPGLASYPADPFEALPGAEGRGRCPVGMGVVGVRVRTGGTYGVMQHLQALCAPLDAWMGASPPTPTRASIAGTWEVDDPPGTQTAQCPPGRFMTGFEVRQFPAAPAAEVIERVAPLCRDLRPAL